MVDLEFIERLIRLLDESGLDHVEIEREGTRVRISKSPPVIGVEEPSAAEGERTDPDGPGSPGLPGSGSTDSEAADAADSGLAEVTAPMVGTFYRAPSPGTDPFTEVGSQIGPGDVLCIIEAMKLMNELEAEISGVVREICVSDGDPVEYGQVLFRVEPS